MAALAPGAAVRVKDDWPETRGPVHIRTPHYLRGMMSVDELRRGIEAIPEADYHRLTYYQRWIRSITDNLLRHGVITEAELRAALAAE